MTTSDLHYCDTCDRSEIALILEGGYKAGLLQMNKMKDGVILCEECARGEGDVAIADIRAFYADDERRRNDHR